MSRSKPRSRSARDCDRPRPSDCCPTRFLLANSPHLHRRYHRHARTKLQTGILIEHDLDRDALDHLDIVAGRVLRWQQAECGTAARLNAVDMTAEGPSRIGVDRNVDRLTRPHQVELGLLEI